MKKLQNDQSGGYSYKGAVSGNSRSSLTQYVTGMIFGLLLAIEIIPPLHKRSKGYQAVRLDRLGIWIWLMFDLAFVTLSTAFVTIIKSF